MLKLADRTAKQKGENYWGENFSRWQRQNPEFEMLGRETATTRERHEIRELAGVFQTDDDDDVQQMIVLHSWHADKDSRNFRVM